MTFWERERERPQTEIHKSEMDQIKVNIYIRKIDVKAESQVSCPGLIIIRRLVESAIYISCQCLLQNYN